MRWEGEGSKVDAVVPGGALSPLAEMAQSSCRVGQRRNSDWATLIEDLVDWERGLIGRLLEMGGWDLEAGRSGAQANLRTSLGFSPEDGRQAVCARKAVWSSLSLGSWKISQRS